MPSKQNRQTINPKTIATVLAEPKLSEASALVADPAAFAAFIEETFFMDVESPVTQSYQRMRTTFLNEFPAVAHLHSTVSQLDDYVMVEAAIRNAAFTLGFTLASRMLAAVPAANGGAR